MKRFGYGLVTLTFLGLGSGIAWGGKTAPAADHQAGSLTHGKYLVTRAAPCADCHSPRDKMGQYIPGRDLQGAPIDLKPIHPIPGWVAIAPSIAGLPVGWSFGQTVHFLETGARPDGSYAGPCPRSDSTKKTLAPLRSTCNHCRGRTGARTEAGHAVG